MTRFREGDARAFEALFQRYARPLHGYLARLTGSPAAAEDLSQQTFLSLVRARGRTPSPPTRRATGSGASAPRT
jgi:DNA-directed RNA polymerase specialized sigma24 family protein